MCPVHIYLIIICDFLGLYFIFSTYAGLAWVLISYFFTEAAFCKEVWSKDNKRVSSIMLENKHKKTTLDLMKGAWGLTSLRVFRCVGAACLQETGVSVSITDFWVNVSYTNPVTAWTSLMKPREPLDNLMKSWLLLSIKNCLVLFKLSYFLNIFIRIP